MVSKASDDFPDPERPVKTTSLSRGMVRSMSLRLCSRAPLMTISVCCMAFSMGEGVVFVLPMHPCPHPAGLWFAPLSRLGGCGGRQRRPVIQGVAAKPDQAIAQLSGPLELQVPGRLLHLPLQVFDQPFDLIRRKAGCQRRDAVFHGVLLLAFEVVDGFDDGGRRDAVLLVVCN